MSEWTEQIAWLAGLFDGEGSLSLNVGVGGLVRPNATIHMTDEDVVRKAHEVWGGNGFALNTAPSRNSRKPSWRTTLWRWDDVAMWATRMSPWLGERRLRRVADVLELNQLRKEFGTTNRSRWLEPRGTATHCKRGHERSPANTYVQSNGGKRCRPCHALLSRQRKAA